VKGVSSVVEPVRFAPVGLGWWGRVLATSAVESGAGELVSCYSRREEARDAFAESFGCSVVASMDDVLGDDRVEAVFVATPHSTHADIVVAALEAGKHVLVEKPLAVTVQDAERCVCAAAEAGLVLQVGHHRRRQAANRRIKAMIDEGELGTVVQIEANQSAPAMFGWPEDSWRRHRAELPAGAMTVMGCHMLDTMQYLVGPPSRVCAMSKRVIGSTDVDDATAVLIEFESGPLGYVGTSPAVPSTNYIAVYGTDASAWNESDGQRLFVQRCGKDTRTEVSVEQNDPIAEALADFARCIREGGIPETDGESGLTVVRMVEAAARSAEERMFIEFGTATVVS
jgi:predicted dehydrogenase